MGQIGTYLFGRKMYETMAVWVTPDVIPHRTAAVLEFAPIWQAAEKIDISVILNERMNVDANPCPRKAVSMAPCNRYPVV